MLNFKNEVGQQNKRSLLIICNDVVGHKMAGPAIRCVEIAKSASQIFLTTLASPKINDNYSASFSLVEIRPLELKELAIQSDVVIIQGDALVLYPFLKEISGVLIADLYCPIPLEYHQVSDNVDLDVRLETNAHLSRVVNEQLAYADFFLCASEKQRDFWLGALTISGRINGLRWKNSNHADIKDLIITLPFGIENSEPAICEHSGVLRSKYNIPTDHFVVIWGGGIYEWFDPLTIIKAIHVLVEKGEMVHLVFLGVKHPNSSIHDHDMCARAVSLARELGLLDKFVHFNFGWVDYNTRHEYLMDANIGVSAHFDNPETRFSFRTRILDYLWCNLPIISTRGDFFGEAVGSQRLGVVVDFETVEGWVEAIGRLSKDRKFYAECSKNIIGYKEQFRWKNVTRPLLEVIERIDISRDREYARNLVNKNNLKSSFVAKLWRAHSEGGIVNVLNSSVRYCIRHLYYR